MKEKAPKNTDQADKEAARSLYDWLADGQWERSEISDQGGTPKYMHIDTTGKESMKVNAEIDNTEKSVHPGTHLKNCIDKIGLSVARLAEIVDLDVSQLYRIMRGNSDITAITAVKLENNNIGGSAEEWMVLQNTFDITAARSIVKSAKKPDRYSNRRPKSLNY